MKRLILVSILVCSIKCFGASGGLSGSPLSGGGSGGGSAPVAGANISVAGSTVNLVSQPSFDAVNVSNTFNEPTTVFVRSNGVNVTAMRGNHQFPFLTMQAAKAVLQTGDTMDIGPGTFNGVCDKTNCFYNLLENCVLDALPCVSATNGYIFIRGKGSLIGDLMLSNATAIVECNLCAFNFGSGAPVTIGNTTNYLILQHFRTYATDFGSSSNLTIVGRGDLGIGAIGNWSKSNNHGDFIVRRWGLPSVTTFDFTGSTPTKHSLNIICDVAYFDDSGGSLPINFANGTITLTANQIFFANSASGPAMSLTGTIGALPSSVANILGSPFVNTNVPIPVEPRNPDFDILGL